MVTVPDENTFIEYPSVTGTGPLTFDFPYFAKADLEVRVNGTALATSGFTDTPGTGSATAGYDGGSITLGASVTAAVVTIARNQVAERSSNLSSGQSTGTALNAALNKLTMHAQERRRDTERSIKFPLGDDNSSYQLPAAAARASKAFTFDENGDVSLLAVTDVATVAANISDVVTVAGDLNGDDSIGAVAADLAGDDTIGGAAALLAVTAPGIVAKDSSGTPVSREITVGDGLSITNGNGGAGNPLIELDGDLVTVADAPSLASAGKFIRIKLDGSGFDAAFVPGGGDLLAANRLVELAGAGAAAQREASGNLGVRRYESRAALITDAPTGNTGDLAFSGDGLAYYYSSGATAVSDLSDWLPVEPARQEHFAASNTGVAAYLSSLSDVKQAVTSTINHPDVRQRAGARLSGTANPMYVVSGVDDVRVTVALDQDSQAGTFRVHEDVNGFFIQDCDIESDGFSLLVKPGLGGAGWAENGVICTNNVRGEATTTDIGISIDGDTRNVVAALNVIKNVQRSDGGGNPPHAFAVAGDHADPDTNADCSNIMIALNVIDDIAGNAFHTEDSNYGLTFALNVARQVSVGIEVSTGTSLSAVQNYLGNSIIGWTEYAIDAVGTGSSLDTNYLFNLLYGAGVTASGSYAVRINQPDTKNINYGFNVLRDTSNSAIQSDANGPLNFIASVFNDIAGDVFTLSRTGVIARIAYNMIDTVTGDVIVGNSTDVFSPTDQRSLLVESNNAFTGVSGAIVDKTACANVAGDQTERSPLMDASIASTATVFVAQRPGIVTAIKRVISPDGGGGGSTSGNFTVYAGATKIIDNAIPRVASASATYLWTAQNAQVEAVALARGDVITVVSDGDADRSTKFVIEIEFFYYN